MKLSDRERDIYDEIWSHDEYASFSPGAEYVDLFIDMSGAVCGQTVLDAGAGSGKGAVALAERKFRVSMCDLTSAGLVRKANSIPFTRVNLWSDLSTVGRHDWVYCCDVMEHLPMPFTMLVASRLLDVATRGVFFSISLVPDQFGALIGQPLHKSVQSFVEWRTQLSELGKMVECRDLISTGLYVVRP